VLCFMLVVNCTEKPSSVITPDAISITLTSDGSAVLRKNGVEFKFELISGIYDKFCEGHNQVDHDPWSVGINQFSPVPHPLKVIEYSACRIIATSVQANGVTYVADTPFAFTNNDYAPLASAFRAKASSSASRDDVSPISFFGNLKTSDHTLSSNFILTLYTSDDVNLVTPSVYATYGNTNSITAQGTMETVPSPNYSADLSSITISVSATNTLMAETGALVLVAANGAQTGERYVVVTGAPATDIASLINAFGDYNSANVISGSINIPIANLFALGTQLPTQNTVLIAHKLNDIISIEYITVSAVSP